MSPCWVPTQKPPPGIIALTIIALIMMLYVRKRSLSHIAQFPVTRHLERKRRGAKFAPQFAMLCYQFGPQFVYLLKSWDKSLIGQKVQHR
jgi:hypothetical protein